MATTVFRVDKKENYTIISNYHLQDKNLSNKAKGLLTIMLSLPPSWDMTLKGLVSLSSDGIDAIRTTISELEKNGYLSRTRTRDELGRMQCTEYTIHEQPALKQNENLNPEPKDENFKQPTDDITENESYNNQNALLYSASEAEKSQIGKSDVDQVGKSDVDQIGLSYIGKTYIGKSNTINDLSNKDTYDINDLSYQSNYKNNKVNNKDEIDKIKAEELIKKRNETERLIKDNIDYDTVFDEDEDKEFLNFVNLCLEIIVDVITSSKPIIYVKGQEFPTQTVASQMEKITIEQIEYVWDCIQHTTTGIKNIQNYILTALYNSVNSQDIYWTQLVNHDLAQSNKT